MGFALRCAAGDLAGQSFPVAEAPRSVGRSHRADIRSALPDVSSIHALASVHGGELRVEVVSVRVTTLNGRPLRQGDIVPLAGGDVLRMGGTLAFEAVCPPPSAPPPDDTPTMADLPTLAEAPPLADTPTLPAGGPEPPQRTRALGTAPSVPNPGEAPCRTQRLAGPHTQRPGGGHAETGSDDRTAFFDPSGKTRAVTPEELRLMAEREGTRRRNRLRRRGFLLLALAAVGVAVLLKALWKDTSPLPPLTHVAFVLPECGPGEHRREVAVKGVPVRIALEVADAPEELRRSRAASMRAWFDARQGNGHVYEIDDRWRREEARILTQRYATPGPDEIFTEDFRIRRGIGHGLPGIGLRYVHTEPSGARWAGSAVLVRRGERRWVLVREVPWEARDRAARLLFSASPYLVPWRAGEDPAEATDRFWDFTPGLPAARNALGEAVLAERLRHPNPDDWPRMDESLAAHLCATRPGTPERARWERLLAEFRAVQRRWVANHPLTEAETRCAFPFPERDTRAVGRSVR